MMAISTPATSEENRLNNLVIELGNWKTAMAPFTFYNPRSGWVFIAVETPETVEGKVTLASSDGTQVCDIGLSVKPAECMRWLEAGEYSIQPATADTPPLDAVVRAIPEMHFCRFPVSPKIPEFGTFDWEFLKKFVLPNVNTIVGNPTPEIDQYITEWTNSGRKWIGYYGLPHHDDLTGPKAYDYWTSHVGFHDPRLSGLIADEFSGRQNQWYPAWIEGMKLLGDSKERSNRAFYGYCGGPAMHTRPQAREMVRTIFENDFYMAYERYHQEEPTLNEMNALMDRLLGSQMVKWRATFPGCEKKMVMVLGLFAQGMGLNVRPDVDFKVLMDLQMQYLATHPAFKDMFGVHWWVADYADDELIKWLGALYRHYGIEGNTDLLSDRYGYVYELKHIQNPDFFDGFAGWRVMPATINSMETGYTEWYARTQGRYWHRAEFPDEPAGNTYMVMKRDSVKSNQAMQLIRNLKPGALYSAKMIAADYDDITKGISQEKQLHVDMAVSGAETIADKSFHTTYSCQGWEPFNNKPAWFNFHRVVFRAESESAWLVIADQPKSTVPTADDANAVMVNFIEVQPYYDPVE